MFNEPSGEITSFDCNAQNPMITSVSDFLR